MPTIVQGTTHDAAGKRWIMRSKFYIQGDVCRMELPSVQDGNPAPADAPANFLVIILDGKEKKALQLDYVAKTAKTTSADEKMWQHMSRSLADPIKQLRELKEGDAERIGEEELDGVKTQVYRLTGKDIFMGLTLEKGETAKLWVDPKSGLPVRLSVGDPEDKDKMFMVFKDFRWNEALEPGLFKLDVPKAFRVVDK
jgi:outer membrane lipoprotein-sorting protein